MKNFNYLSLIILLLFLFAAPNNLFAKDKEGGKGKKPGLQKTAVNPSQTLMNINNATMWVTEEGFHDWVVASGWNGAFPSGTTVGAIFAEGMVWGGQVSDGSSPTVRVNGNTYGTGCAPITRIYRVRPDYLTGDLTLDAATFNDIPLGDVTAADIQAIRDQYELDWNEWPANEGALFEDVNNNGTYEPEEDIPGVPGASQTIFIKYNDSESTSNYGSPPIGLEITETYWAYAASGPLANVIYKKVDIVYKGTLTSAPNSQIDSMYIVQWADPDVGNSTDDFAGCDTILNLGYAYSSGSTDATYDGLNLAPPAVGYDFLQGVSVFTGNPADSAIFDLKWRKGYKYINPRPMSSFVYFAAGGTWSDPSFNYNGTLEFYNLMRGFLPIPRYPSASPFPTSVADVTPYGTYLLTGDPVTGAGKIDGSVDGPGDRRTMVTNGPITMTLNDTAQVVLALVYGLGRNNLSSISVMKFNDASAQFAYDQLFEVPLMTTPDVTFAELDGKISVYWNQSDDIKNVTENTPQGPYNFQAYALYQLPPGSNDISKGVRITTFDVIDNISTLNEKVLDENTGIVYIKPLVPLDNAGISRNFVFDKDYINNKDLIRGQSYTFAITSIGYNDDPGLPSFILESAPAIITGTPQTPTPGTRYFGETGDTIAIEHTGTADGGPTVTIVDPTAFTGDEYEIFFTEEAQIRNENGDWVPASTVLRKTRIMDPDTLTGSSVDISAIFSPTAGVIELTCYFNYVTPDGNWCDGIEMDFPSSMTIIDAPGFEAGGGPITPVVAGNHIEMGDVSGALTGDGWFHGGETWTIYVSTFDLPSEGIDWEIWDDGWSGGAVNAVGTTIVEEIGYAARLADHWNLRDVTTGDIKLEKQSVINGIDLYPPRDDSPTELGLGAAPVIDGVQINLEVGYGAPVDFTTLTVDGDGSYDIDSYLVYGWAPTAMAIDTWGAGTTDIAELQKDYELRFTGEYDDPTASVVYVKEGTGSIATLEGARNYDLADHPMNPNPGSNDPFTVRIPFEVWSIDDEKQINILVYDREGDPTVTPFYAFNPAGRMYCHFLPTDYHETVVDINGPEVDNLTWNTVWWEADWVNGDVLTFQYDNPIIKGVDKYTFKTKASTYSRDLATNQVDKINVFPNPYYGFHSRETSPTNKYVTFSHLPDNAIIRIFDLSGVLVKTITHVSTSGQFDTWNLQNDNNLPVASGIYIVYIDMPDLGTTKILKLAIIQEQQILKVY